MTILGRRVPAALCILAMAFFARFAAMVLLPLTDPTEGRYAQVSQEMAVTGDWVTPRIWMNEVHLPFMGKPPLFFWSAAGAMKLFGENEFAARLPSLVATLLLLALLYVVLERYGGGSGFASVLITASCGFFFAVSGVVAVDMLLAACVAGSLLAYFAFTCEPSRQIRGSWSLLVFFLLALGFLTKGPVAVVLFGLPVFVWTVRWRQWKSLRDHSWVTGSLLFIILVVPWFVLCESRNPGFLKYFFLNENLLRFVTHDYGDAYGSGHQYPRGSALLMFLATAAPWGLFALWQVARSRSAARILTLADRQESFLFLGFAVGTLFWCLARQLLFTYMLPLLPLFTAWLALRIRHDGELTRKAVVAASLLLAVMGAAALVCPLALRETASSRQIVRVAHSYADEQAFKGPLIFGRKTPYSALFYARGWALTHPKEPLGDTLARCREHAETVLVAVPVKKEGEVVKSLSESASRVASTGKWSLLSVALRSPERPAMTPR